MKKHILGILTCPSCREYLALETFVEKNSEVKEGLLSCSCENWFPIINYIPRLLLGNYRGDYGVFLKTFGLKSLEEGNPQTIHSDSGIAQTQRSFSSKWTSQPSWGIQGETKAFTKRWITKRYGWENIQRFEDSLKNRRLIMDAGTGVGRAVMDFCEVNKNGEVLGVDMSEAVEAAYQNTKTYPNAHIIQADLMNLPFKEKSFDFIFSEGVLHHTPDTHKAFEVLIKFLAVKGEIGLYVYKKKGPIREFCDDTLRQVTTKLSAEGCWEFSTKMTKFGKALSDLHIEFEIPEDIPILEIKAGRYNLQRFFYYYILKCFWNDRFTFDENNLVNFDWYHPAHAHRHTLEEVKRWFKKGGLQLLHFNISESGITARGLKPS